MKKIFFYLAAAGFLFTLVLHLATIAGINLIGWAFYAAGFLGCWLLFLMVWVMLFRSAINGAWRFGKRSYYGLKDWLNGPLRDTPTWLLVVGLILLFYAPVNAALRLSASTTPGAVSIENGRHLQVGEHGQVIRELGEQEAKALDLSWKSAFSGVCLLFFCIEAALLYPFGKRHNRGHHGPGKRKGRASPSLTCLIGVLLFLMVGCQAGTPAVPAPVAAPTPAVLNTVVPAATFLPTPRPTVTPAPSIIPTRARSQTRISGTPCFSAPDTRILTRISGTDKRMARYGLVLHFTLYMGSRHALTPDSMPVFTHHAMLRIVTHHAMLRIVTHHAWRLSPTLPFSLIR